MTEECSGSATIKEYGNVMVVVDVSGTVMVTVVESHSVLDKE